MSFYLSLSLFPKNPVSIPLFFPCLSVSLSNCLYVFLSLFILSFCLSSCCFSFFLFLWFLWFRDSVFFLSLSFCLCICLRLSVFRAFYLSVYLSFCFAPFYNTKIIYIIPDTALPKLSEDPYGEEEIVPTSTQKFIRADGHWKMTKIEIQTVTAFLESVLTQGNL